MKQEQNLDRRREGARRLRTIHIRATDLQSAIESLQEIRRTERPALEPGIASRYGKELDHLEKTVREGGFDERLIDSPEVRERRTAWFVEKTLSEANTLIDAACLVFAHSVLDAHVFELCKLTAFLEPESWLSQIEKKQVTLLEAKAATYESNRDRLLEKFFEDLDGRSLLWKIDLLHARCKPQNASTLRGFKFDRQKLDEIDRRRHEIVHGDALRTAGSTLLDDVRFLNETTDYCTIMVLDCYGLRASDELGFSEEFLW